ncbi:LmeA family phospholipid-binding protein [Fimbriimonas ginsengisoli]|uniref:DUF2993 domain-containing protein n=1 Tax=Fimbriimonas ginsengisoli Gsoil 348 TaxID=661478 RepID=A0A068NUN2_FIMGI|nr:DUF2993 domain-containing protein [Fimbriimonas ginsengisoli]AIE87248.1 hypothetical protein OP10G_3880 [Fimbriimonas ginsengisoli Gsoil 348]
MTPILVGLVGLGLIRTVNAEVHRFERLAATEISSLLSGDRKRVDIKSSVGPEAIFGDIHRVSIVASGFSSDGLPLYTEPWRSQRGVLHDLRIDMRDFTLRGLRVARLQADIPDCRFDLALALRDHRFRLSRSGLGIGEVEVTAADLEAFILAKFHEVKTAHVRMDRDKLFIEGRAELILLTTDFFIAARLEPAGGSRLVLTHPRVLFDGNPADPELQKVLLEILNPVVDLDRDLGLSGAMKVDRVVLRNGTLRASGVTKIPSRERGTKTNAPAL